MNRSRFNRVAADWRSLAGEFIFVDVGSRGGFHDMRLLHPSTHIYSFDADETTEPALDGFASYRHFPIALYSSDREMDLFVTAHAGMSSLLEFDETVFLRHFGLMPGSETWRQTLSLVRRQKTAARRADPLFRREGLRRIDFLKLDTQGTELEVLKGMSEILDGGGVSVIKTEVSFVPVYRNQCTFGEIDGFLKQHGFTFVDCMFYPDAVHEPRSMQAVRHTGLLESLRFGAVGDAVYLRDPANDPKAGPSASTIRSAIVLNQLGYVSMAFDLLQARGCKAEFTVRLLRATARGSTPKARLNGILKTHLPPWAYRGARRLYGALFPAR